MKRKILSLIFAICLIMPLAVALSACDNPNSVVKYTVSFYNEDGSLLKTIQVMENKKADCPIVTKDADRYNVYHFYQWLTLDGKEATDSLNNVTEDLSVKPRFISTQPDYEIAFYKEDGFFYSSIMVKRGYAGAFPSVVPTKASDNEYDYVFDCWVDINGNEITDDLSIISSNMKFYARFNAVSKTDNAWEQKSKWNFNNIKIKVSNNMFGAFSLLNFYFHKI